jgi:DNA-binding MarR family transcriptional regulator
MDVTRQAAAQPRWLLVSSHGLVLFYIANQHDSTIVNIAEALGLTPRRVVAIVKDLAQANLIQVQRRGRRNQYRVLPDAHFIHPTMAHVRVADFVDLLTGAKVGEPSRNGGGQR